MKRIFILFLVAVAAFAAAALADHYTTARSSLTITGTSTLHDWKIESSTINGEVVAPPISAWKDGITSVKVSIPVASIKADHDRMTRIMQEALKAKENPEIRYELTTASLQNATADTFNVKAHGKLTIAGVTRDVDLDIEGKRITPISYTLSGSTPIRMTDYGIKPPVTMMNTLKTGNDVNVAFHWVVETR